MTLKQEAKHSFLSRHRQLGHLVDEELDQVVADRLELARRLRHRAALRVKDGRGSLVFVWEKGG